MMNLIYIVLIALVGVFVDVLFRPGIRRLLEVMGRWITRHAPRLVQGLVTFHESRSGVYLRAFLTLVGLLTVLYVLAFIVLVSMGGTPALDAPGEDIYVPYDQQGEARIVASDKSLRGILLRKFFPPVDLMQVQITAPWGELVLPDANPSQRGERVMSNAHDGQVVIVRYVFAEGYDFGKAEVSVFGLWADPKKDTPAGSTVIGFVRARR